MGLSESSQLRFRASVEKQAIPQSSHFCLLEDAEKFYAAPSVKSLAAGSIVAEKGFESLCKSVEGTLRAYSTAAVFYHTDFTLFVCCTRQSKWAQLFNCQKEAQQGADLLFYLSTPVGAGVETPAIREDPLIAREVSNHQQDDPDTMVKLANGYDGNAIPGLNYDRVLVWPNDGTLVKANIFLMLNETRTEEISGLTRYFSTIGAKVYHSAVEGSWDFFVNHVRNGAIIVSDTVATIDRTSY